ncbi:MAG: filamentous hemagglutinin N-terminal domain-containing protein [Nitrospira sp.]
MQDRGAFLATSLNSVRIIASICLTFISISSFFQAEVRAEVTTSITVTTGTGNLNTTITQNDHIYNITNGTRVGTNVFHSFGNFSVGATDVANFQNTAVNGVFPPTSNILGRVSGGNISNIFGTVQTTGFGDANLFLMNQAGFLFGPDSALNVGGIVTFTSADYLRLTDGGRFNTSLSPSVPDLLTTAPVVAFGFLGQSPGAITIRGSQFTVSEQKGISLVGGNITVESGTLDDNTTQPTRIFAPGGQISLGSAASPGEILATNLLLDSGMTLGSISITQGSTLDVSSDAAGTVTIRGGQLVIDDGTISADTVTVDGAPTSIDINVAGNILISDTRNSPALTARTSGTGSAGDIQIMAANFEGISTSDSFEPSYLVDTTTSGVGRAGTVSITTGILTVSNLNPLFGFIGTGTLGEGHGGDVAITAESVRLQNTSINTGDAFARLLFQEASGSAGNLTIESDSLRLTNAALFADAFSAFANSQQAGNVTLNVRDISMNGGAVTAIGIAKGGAIFVATDRMITDFTIFESNTVSGPGGGITINANAVEMTNASSLISTTFGDGQAGDIHVTTTDHVSLLGTGPFSAERPTGFFSNSTGDFGPSGDAGNIFVTTPRLEIAGGARINTSTISSGRGGDVRLNVIKEISISGELPIDEPEPIFGIGSVHPSGVFTKTVGSDLCVNACGDAGRILVTAGSLTLTNGAQINSGTSNNGHGGDITVHSTKAIDLSGTLADGSPVGIFSRSIGTAPDAGPGGKVTLAAGQSVTIQNRASVSASSTGPGNAGDISINAGQQLDVQNGSITTKADQASGGNIDIRAIDQIRFVSSHISASVGADSGNGGNITIDPNVVILQNAQILANAVQGHGGNITITTPVFLQDQASLVDASSQFGVNGTVKIQSPTSNLSETVTQLPSKPSEIQALLQNRCAALAGGEQSTFIVAGRDALPSQPGGWLSSPVSMDHFTGEDLEHAAGPSAIAHVTETEIVSLRRLTPPGFLVRAFASGSTGCHS